MYYSAQKLHKVGEFGHGKNILCLYSGASHIHNKFFLHDKHRRVNKFFVHYLDLTLDKSHLESAIINTLNHYKHVNVLLVDFITFVKITQLFQKVHLFQERLDHLIVFNPIKPRSSLVRRFLGYKYTNLNGETIKLNRTKLHWIFEFYKKVPELSLGKVDIISQQDIYASIKLATFYKNSKLIKTKKFEEFIHSLEKIL